MVMNMTKQELKDYPYLFPAIERYEKELTELSADYKRNEKRIIELRAKINDYHERIHNCELFFESIEDIQTRQIFELRYIHRMKWSDIAAHIGGYNTPDTVRMICCRYLKKT